MRKASRQPRRHKRSTPTGRPSIGIRALKTAASAIVREVRNRRVTYAVTRRGVAEALIMPVDAGERLLSAPQRDGVWETWDALAAELEAEAHGKLRSAAAELSRMRR